MEVDHWKVRYRAHEAVRKLAVHVKKVRCEFALVGGRSARRVSRVSKAWSCVAGIVVNLRRNTGLARGTHYTSSVVGEIAVFNRE